MPDVNSTTGEGSGCDAADTCVLAADCPFQSNCDRIAGRSVFEGISSATLLKPGDRVIVRLAAGSWSPKQRERAETLLPRFAPDVAFALFEGVEEFLIAPAGDEETPGLDFYPKVKVRFTFAIPPFRASWTWKGRERSIARWGPFAARDRADDLIDAAVELELRLRQWDRATARIRKDWERRMVEWLGEEGATEIFRMTNGEGGQQ